MSCITCRKQRWFQRLAEMCTTSALDARPSQAERHGQVHVVGDNDGDILDRLDIAFLARTGDFAQIGHGLGHRVSFHVRPRRATRAINTRVASQADRRERWHVVHKVLHLLPAGAKTDFQWAHCGLSQMQAGVHLAPRVDDKVGFPRLAVKIVVVAAGRFAQRGFCPFTGRGAVGGFQSDTFGGGHPAVFDLGSCTVAPFDEEPAG